MGKNFGGGLATTMLSHVALRSGILALLLPVPLFAQSWTQRTPATAPPARNSSPAAFDVYRGATVLFGGFDGTATPRSDTWEWNGTDWIQRTSPVTPTARWGHGMVYDSRRGKVVLFGGYDGAAARNDTWEWDGANWQQRALVNPPPVRSHFGMAYDDARGTCIVFGGLGAGLGLLGDTWEFDGNAWTQHSTATAPSPRRGLAMMWDETRQHMVLFGGFDGSALRDDTWTWDGTAWLQAQPSTAPSPRQDAALAFDGNCGRGLLVGGRGTTITTNFGDAWAWTGTSWSQLSGTSPSARHGAALAHDAQRGQFVCFGGRDGAGFRSDTWELGPSCNRTMSTLAPAVVGQTAQFRYTYPGVAANSHFCWTLLTARQPAALPLAIPGFPSIGLCRVDLLNVILDPATILDGSGSLVTLLPIPNNPAFSGFTFDVQCVDLDLSTLALRWADNDAEVTVGPTAPPVASFTATPTNGIAPLVVQFTDTSTNYPTSWQWDFDNDGVADSLQQNPTWTYAQDGFYSVRLVATNFLGNGAVTRTNLVIVGVQPSSSSNMVPIAPGTFQMGSTAGQPNEQPVRQVTLSAPFWMGKYEVTQAEYQAVMGSNPSYFQGFNAPNAPQRPVETVSWNSAVAYCQALTTIEQSAGRVPQGYQYRLPTEAEWEYCCRAGTVTEWHTGTNLSTSQANLAGVLANSIYINGQTSMVGSYAPNSLGLHDMHGNVSEMCLDSYAFYSQGPTTDPYVTGGTDRVSRGGSFFGISNLPPGASINYSLLCRSAIRGYIAPGLTNPGIGFRVVLAPALAP